MHSMLIARIIFLSIIKIAFESLHLIVLNSENLQHLNLTSTTKLLELDL